MVQFDPDGFTITVKTRFPAQDYLNVVEGIINLIQSQDNNESDKPVYSLMLLKSMLPAESDVQKLIE